MLGNNQHFRSWIEIDTALRLQEATSVTTFVLPACNRENLVNIPTSLDASPMDLPELFLDSLVARLCSLARPLNKQFRYELRLHLFGEWDYRTLVLGDKSFFIKQLAKVSRRFLLRLFPTLCLLAYATVPRYFRIGVAKLGVALQVRRKHWRQTLAVLEGHAIVLLPSNGSEFYLNGMALLARRKSLISILCIDNWDNISSKAPIVFLPTFVTLMGEDSIVRATDIHKFRPQACLPIGLPKFAPILEAGQQARGAADSECVTIAYLGSNSAHPEEEIVNLLADALKSAGFPGKFRFVYRPHPIRLTLPNGFPIPQLQSAVQVHSHSGNEKRRFGNYPLISKSYVEELLSFEIVVSSPTTMALEAALLGAKVIIDAVPDERLVSSIGRVWDKYDHLADLEKLGNVAIARSRGDLVECLLEAVSGKIHGALVPETLVSCGDYAASLGSFIRDRSRGMI